MLTFVIATRIESVQTLSEWAAMEYQKNAVEIENLAQCVRVLEERIKEFTQQWTELTALFRTFQAFMEDRELIP